MPAEFVLRGESHHVEPVYRRDGVRLSIDGEVVDAALEDLGGGEFLLELDGELTSLRIATWGDAIFVHEAGESFRIDAVNSLERAAEEAAGSRGADQILAPMPGVVVGVVAPAGTPVKRGDPVLTIESMKLETSMTAPRDGVIAAVLFEAGAGFGKGAVLATLVPADDGASS